MDYMNKSMVTKAQQVCKSDLSELIWQLLVVLQVYSWPNCNLLLDRKTFQFSSYYYFFFLSHTECKLFDYSLLRLIIRSVGSICEVGDNSIASCWMLFIVISFADELICQKAGVTYYLCIISVQEILLQQVMSHISSVKKDMIILEKSEFSSLKHEYEVRLRYCFFLLMYWLISCIHRGWGKWNNTKMWSKWNGKYFKTWPERRLCHIYSCKQKTKNI